MKLYKRKSSDLFWHPVGKLKTVPVGIMVQACLNMNIPANKRWEYLENITDKLWELDT